MIDQTSENNKIEQRTFSGNIYIFQAFDVGDDIQLDHIESSKTLSTLPLTLPKYFKNYHVPLAIALPNAQAGSRCISSKIHNFGAISLTYKIPFNDTFEELRKKISNIDNEFKEQSFLDVKTIYKKIKPFIVSPKFFQTRSSYLVIEVDPQTNGIDIASLKEQYGGLIASMLRFETQSLSEYQKDEILNDAIGYFRGDLIVIDTEASFIYDEEYEEILDFFEFANIQQLELRYFDRLLDHQLNTIYEGKVGRLPIKAYLPFIGGYLSGSVADLGRLKVDISVIIERIESSIKVAGEAYYSELYSVLMEKLDIQNWKESIDRKLLIIKDIRDVYEHKTDSAREDLVSILIIMTKILDK